MTRKEYTEKFEELETFYEEEYEGDTCSASEFLAKVKEIFGDDYNTNVFCPALREYADGTVEFYKDPDVGYLEDSFFADIQQKNKAIVDRKTFTDSYGIVGDDCSAPIDFYLTTDIKQKEDNMKVYLVGFFEDYKSVPEFLSNIDLIPESKLVEHVKVMIDEEQICPETIEDGEYDIENMDVAMAIEILDGDGYTVKEYNL